MDLWLAVVAIARASNAHAHILCVPPLLAPTYDIMHFLGMHGLVGKGHFWMGAFIQTQLYHTAYVTDGLQAGLGTGICSGYCWVTPFDGYLEFAAEGEGPRFQAFWDFWSNLRLGKDRVFGRWLSRPAQCVRGSDPLVLGASLGKLPL